MKVRNLLSSTLLIGTAIAIATPSFAQDEDDSLANEKVFIGAELSNDQVTGGGLSGGSGEFTGEMTRASGQLCYTLALAGVDAPTAAHIHAGAEGEDGEAVITLKITGKSKKNTCIDVPADVLQKLIENPFGYYVNVHNAAYPAGAVRGQLDYY